MENKWAWILHMNGSAPKHSEKHLVTNQEQLEYAEDRYLKFCGIEPMSQEAYDVIESGIYKDGKDSYYLILVKDFGNGKSKRSHQGNQR